MNYSILQESGMSDLAFLRFGMRFWAIRDSLTSSPALGYAMSKPRDDRQKTERPVASGAGSNHRFGSPAGTVGWR